MRKLTFLALSFTVFLSCSSPSSKNSEDTSTQINQSSTPNTSKKTDNHLPGKVKITIGSKEFLIDKFIPTHSEIILMNENKMSVRLTSLDKEMTIKVLLSGPDIYGKLPLNLSLDADQYEKNNHASVTLEGFIQAKDNLDALNIVKGEGVLTQFDKSSKEFKIDFSGKGIHQYMGDSGFKRTDIDQIEGSIEIIIDNIQDMRKNKD